MQSNIIRGCGFYKGIRFYNKIKKGPISFQSWEERVQEGKQSYM